MVNRLLMPQEIEAFYVLPALRRDLAKFMKGKNYSQKKVAKLLGVTEPAVSQYLNSKRATEIVFSKNLTEKIREAADKINSQDSLIEQLQLLLSVARSENVICNLHKKMGFKCHVGFCLGKQPVNIKKSLS